MGTNAHNQAQRAAADARDTALYIGRTFGGRLAVAIAHDGGNASIVLRCPRCGSERKRQTPFMRRGIYGTCPCQIRRPSNMPARTERARRRYVGQTFTNPRGGVVWRCVDVELRGRDPGHMEPWLILLHKPTGWAVVRRAYNVRNGVGLQPPGSHQATRGRVQWPRA